MTVRNTFIRRISRDLLLVLAALILLALTGCGVDAESQAAVSSESQAAVSPETQTASPETQTASAESQTNVSPESLTETQETEQELQEDAPALSESATPTEKDELAAYIRAFGHLPGNFITKNEAKELGWVSSKGNLWEVAPGCSIGGDRFGNYEGRLPDAPGRKYYECDVGFEGGHRDARRIVFSNDGLIYYTDDHYESFELLYGEEG